MHESTSTHLFHKFCHTLCRGTELCGIIISRPGKNWDPRILDPEEHLVIRPFWGTFRFIERILSLFLSEIVFNEYIFLILVPLKLIDLCYMLIFCFLWMYIIVFGPYINEKYWGTYTSQNSGSEEHSELFPGLFTQPVSRSIRIFSISPWSTPLSWQL